MQHIIFIFYIWALLAYGLYFANHLYSFAIVVAAVVGVMMVYEKIRGMNITKIPMWLVLLPFLYVLPLLFGRVESIQATWNQMIVMSVLVFTAYLLWKLKLEQDGDMKLKLIITKISWFVMLVSYAVLLRVFSLSEFVMELSKDVSGLGARLGGFVQYPNAFASTTSIHDFVSFGSEYERREIEGIFTSDSATSGAFFLVAANRVSWSMVVVRHRLYDFCGDGKSGAKISLFTPISVCFRKWRHFVYVSRWRWRDLCILAYRSFIARICRSSLLFTTW